MKAPINCVLSFIVSLFLITTSNVFASSADDILFVPKDGDEIQTIKPFAKYIEDEKGQLTIEDVVGRSQNFQPLKSFKPAGFTDKVYWIKFGINLSEYQQPHWFLRKEFVHIGGIKVYYLNSDGQYSHIDVDESISNAGRTYSTRNFLFKIPTAITSPAYYYIRVDPRNHPVNLEFSWGTEKAVIEDTHNSQFWLGLFYGGCGVMLLYNTFLLFATRDKAYFYYLYYLVCFTVVFINLNGLLSLEFKYTVYQSKLIILCLYGLQHGGILYARSFLNLRTALPAADRVLKIAQWLVLLGAAISPFLSHIVGFRMALVGIPIALGIALTISFYRWWTGYEPARIYCLGWLVFGILGIEYVLVNYGITAPSAFSTYGVQAGSLWEIVLSCLALAWRIKVLEREKESAQTQSNIELEGKVVARTTALEEARNEVIKSDAEKRKLIQRFNSAVEDERKNVAIEIHDELNASLVVIQLDSQRILDLSKKVKADEISQEIEEKARTVLESTSNLYARGRSIVRRLRPEVLDILGLEGAVEDMVNLYNDAQSGCRFSLVSVGEFSSLENDLSMAAYRIIQESLSNVVKHANASHVTVSLLLIDEKNIVEISIEDDGIGFDTENATTGIGLIGIQERVQAFKGQIDIQSKRGSGTKIVIKFPNFCRRQTTR